ncbi:Beta-ketoacyl synthase, partial [Metarhizium brunneum ARSEF 3297]
MFTFGHSSGEIGAAHFRGKVFSNINTNGAMIAVGLGAEAAQTYLGGYEGRIVLACHNAPVMIIARTVKTGGKAYHSFHMKPAADIYNDLMHEASSHLKNCPRKSIAAFMVSPVTNTALDSARPLDADYRCANLVSPVKFRQAVQTIGSCPVFKYVDLIVVEIRPLSALKGPVKQMCREHKFDKMSCLPTIKRGGNSASQLFNLAGQLFLNNFSLDYERVTAIEETSPPDKIQIGKGKLLVDLPIYQWNYVKELWAEPRRSKEQRAPQNLRHNVLGSHMPGGSKNEPTWRNRLRQIDLPWLKHHSLGGEAVFPAARYFGMATEAVTQMKETSSSPVEIRGYTLHEVITKAALVIPDDTDGIETLQSAAKRPHRLVGVPGVVLEPGRPLEKPHERHY